MNLPDSEGQGSALDFTLSVTARQLSISNFEQFLMLPYIQRRQTQSSVWNNLQKVGKNALEIRHSSSRSITKIAKFHSFHFQFPMAELPGRSACLEPFTETLPID